MITREEIEAKVQEYNERVYQGQMQSSQKELLRKMIERDDQFWEKQWLKEELAAKHGEPRQ